MAIAELKELEEFQALLSLHYDEWMIDFLRNAWEERMGFIFPL